VYIYIFWHFGLPSAAIADALFRNTDSEQPVSPGSARLPITKSIAIVGFAVCGLVWGKERACPGCRDCHAGTHDQPLDKRVRRNSQCTPLVANRRACAPHSSRMVGARPQGACYSSTRSLPGCRQQYNRRPRCRSHRKGDRGSSSIHELVTNAAKYGAFRATVATSR
jgi:hypothetical protein